MLIIRKIWEDDFCEDEQQDYVDDSMYSVHCTYEHSGRTCGEERA